MKRRIDNTPVVNEYCLQSLICEIEEEIHNHPKIIELDSDFKLSFYIDTITGRGMILDHLIHCKNLELCMKDSEKNDNIYSTTQSFLVLVHSLTPDIPVDILSIISEYMFANDQLENKIMIYSLKCVINNRLTRNHSDEEICGRDHAIFEFMRIRSVLLHDKVFYKSYSQKCLHKYFHQDVSIHRYKKEMKALLTNFTSNDTDKNFQIESALEIAVRDRNRKKTDIRDYIFNHHLLNKFLVYYKEDGNYWIAKSERLMNQSTQIVKMNGCLLTENSGTGKTRTVIRAIQLILSQSNRLYMGNTSHLSPGRLLLPNTAIILSSSYVVQHWVISIRTLWPDCKLKIVTQKHEYIGLCDQLKENELDVVIFNRGLFFKKHNNKLKITDDHSFYVEMTSFVFRLSVIDKSHELLGIDSEVQTKQTKNCNLKHAVCINHYTQYIQSIANASFTILISDKPGIIGENCYYKMLVQYLYMIRVQYNNKFIFEYPPDMNDHIISNKGYSDVYQPSSAMMIVPPYSLYRKLQSLCYMFFYNSIIHTGIVLNENIKIIDLKYLDHPIFTCTCSYVNVYNDWFFCNGITLNNKYLDNRARIKVLMEYTTYTCIWKTPNKLRYIKAFYSNVFNCDDLGCIVEEKCSSKDFIDKYKKLNIQMNKDKIYKVPPIFQATISTIYTIIQNRNNRVLLYVLDNVSESNILKLQIHFKRHHDLDLILLNNTNQDWVKINQNIINNNKKILMIDDTEVEGVNLLDITHILIVTTNTKKNDLSLKNIIASNNRLERPGPLNIVKLQPVECKICPDHDNSFPYSVMHDFIEFVDSKSSKDYMWDN